MATASNPSPTSSARWRWSSGAAGVVPGPEWPPGREPAPDNVPMTAACRPSASRTARSRWVVVVLPLVPVTPTTARRADGSP
jgi:hypothetical protein